MALVTIGCGADANPRTRGATLQNAKDNGDGHRR